MINWVVYCWQSSRLINKNLVVVYKWCSDCNCECDITLTQQNHKVHQLWIIGAISSGLFRTECWISLRFLFCQSPKIKKNFYLFPPNSAQSYLVLMMTGRSQPSVWECGGSVWLNCGFCCHVLSAPVSLTTDILVFKMLYLALRCRDPVQQLFKLWSKLNNDYEASRTRNLQIKKHRCISPGAITTPGR